jgi:acyl-CoA dehydrogenase
MSTTTLSPSTTDDASASDLLAIAAEVGAELQPEASARDVSGELSRAAFERLRASGLTAALVPKELGGGGATHAEMGAILRTLARFDPSTAVTLAMHSHLVAAQVWRYHRNMEAPVLAKVAAGAVLVSTGASDWVGSSGSARKVEGGYRISARKSPASGCEVGDVAVTSIRWDDAPDGPQVLHLAVPFSAEGVSIDLTWDTLGLRATGSHTIVFDDVFVPDAAISLARPADQWHPVWNTVMGAAMPLITAAYVGIADAAVDHALAATAGKSDPSTFQLLGEMANAHTTAADVVAAMFVDSDDLRFDNVDAVAARTLSRKTVAAEACIDTVRLAIEAVGGMGYTRGSDLERLYRDVHGALFHPLPRAKQTRFTGRVLQGLTPIG